MSELSNVREMLGWMIGRRIVDVTAGDPPDIPDADEEDADVLVIHLDNGGTLEVEIGDGFAFFDPNRDDSEPAEESDDGT